MIGVFGRLTPWKGQEVLLAALGRPALAACHAVVVGEALFTDEDRHYAAALRERADTPALAGRVRFLGHRDDIPALMKACDVVVHTSTQPEPFGRVIVEGMLAGKPVIATDAGGAREIITHEQTGLLVPPGDAAALAAAVAQLRADSLFAEQLAAAGRAVAVERFTVTAMVNGVRQAVEDLPSARGHPAFAGSTPKASFPRRSDAADVGEDCGSHLV